ncbi:MAG TPA: hypothetical protein VLC50_02390 [Actinomycetes bacterium]|nr:hypothetical protein [Actinomycetes bacterium]
MALPLVVLVIAPVGLLVALTVALRRRPGRFDRHSTAPVLAGLLVGAASAAAVWLADSPRHHLVLTLPAVAGLGWLAGVVVAERTRGHALGTARTASLLPRVPGRYLGRHTLTLMRTTFALAAAVAVAGIVLAAPDGASFARLCADGSVSGHGPFPGARYAVPALAALGLGWLGTEWALREVSRRPPVGPDEQADAAVRGYGARTAIVAAGLIAVPILGGLLVPMGAGLHGACPGPTVSTVGAMLFWSGGLLILLSLLAWSAALASAGRAVVAVPRR